MGPSASHGSGHFYFAQTGHSHFAATRKLESSEATSCTSGTSQLGLSQVFVVAVR
jgi:hypothetical protein